MYDKKSHINMIDVKNAFDRGENIIEFMQNKYGDIIDREIIIEIAYDLQAGSYIKGHNAAYTEKYTNEHFEIIKKFFPDISSVLDVGCGELTNSQALFKKMTSTNEFFACDISWSRCHVGYDFYKSNTPKTLFDKTTIFVGEMLKLPFMDNSIDLIVTSHALEPNHGREEQVLQELLRVSRKGLVLLEPSFELSNDEQRNRMIKHGYIRDLPNIIAKIEHGELIANELTRNYINPLNRTAAFVIKKHKTSQSDGTTCFVDPVSKTELIDKPQYFFSPVRGVSYPIIEKIPVLKPSVEVITNSLAL